MKILVTGSEGNIGQKLVPYLQSCGHLVFCVDVLPGYKPNYVQADIKSPLDIVEPILEFKPQVVYHLAAMVSRVTCEVSPQHAIEANIAGTNNIIQLCKLTGAKLINFSTSEIYGNIGGLLTEDREDICPNNRYGLTKYLAEQLVRYEVLTHGLKATIVRPFMYYDERETQGDHRSAMIRFAESLVDGKQVVIHKGAERSWLHMDDAVRILEKLINTDFSEINIGHPVSHTIEEMADIMCTILNLSTAKHVRVVELPERMTLVKEPCLKKQSSLVDNNTLIPLEVGIKRVIDKLR